jgi:ABC-type multidrug transport system fused ATPase/permease subunit
VSIGTANPFDRAFPTKDLFRGKAIVSLLLSTAASLLFCALLFDLFLVTSLLVTRGRVESAQVAEANKLLDGNGKTSRKNVASKQDGQQAQLPRPLKDHGLLPVVLWSRDRYWGGALTSAFRRIPSLHDNSGALVLLVLTAIGLSLLRVILLARARQLSDSVALETVTRLRRTLHRQTLRLGPADLEESESGRVLELFTTEIERLRRGIAIWIDRLDRYPVKLVLLLALVISIHPLVVLQCLIPLAGCWFLVQRERQRSEAARKLAEDRADDELRLLAEGLGKTRLVSGFAMEDSEHEQFQMHLERFRRDVEVLSRERRWSRWLSRVLVMFSIALVVYLLGNRVLLQADDLSFAAATLILASIASLYGPMTSLWNAREQRSDASLAADRIYRYLARIPEVGQAVGAKFLEPLAKTLHYESVSAGSNEHPQLLDKFDLKVTSGEVIALLSLDPLVVRSAAYLLSRFIEPKSGRVLFDGEDIAWATLESLRAEVIFVGGTDPFFTGTVFENVVYGNPKFSLQDVTEASKIAHAHNFVQKLSQGYETVLGEHGDQLDAGQIFRLGLTRAILRDPALLIVEEPAADLGDDTKALLDDAYNRIFPNRTVILLPSRLSSVRRADRVVLIHEGKTAADGQYVDLVKNSALFRHWEYAHFNPFRDAIRPTT